jgi:hypothetical protein
MTICTIDALQQFAVDIFSTFCSFCFIILLLFAWHVATEQGLLASVRKMNTFIVISTSRLYSMQFIGDFDFRVN